MGDYATTIQFFGSIDSFTTQIVSAWHIFTVRPKLNFGQGELAHRALKMFYPLTNKSDPPAQLAKHERRRRVLRRIAETEGTSSLDNQSPADNTPVASCGKHHYIAASPGNPVNIFTFLREHNGDPAVKVGLISTWTHVTIFSQWLSEFPTKTKGSHPLPATTARHHPL